MKVNDASDREDHIDALLDEINRLYQEKQDESNRRAISLDSDSESGSSNL